MLELIEKVQRDGNADDTVTLPYALRQRSRQRVCLDDGREAALLLPPGTQLDDGDRLRAADGTSVRVRAAMESVATARTDDPLLLARACYHLGNRHVPLQVEPGLVRYQPDHVLDEMVCGLGLTVIHESHPFVPERGAYHGHTNRRDVADEPSRSHATSHGDHH
jgi:urease accessory protein